MDKLTVIKKRSKCHFCGLNKNDFFKYGVMYKLGNIVAHYYCVLLSSKLSQNGKDDEGLLGFLYEDILKELKRNSNILCIYCKRRNANIKCAIKKCKKRFHYPCGLKNGSLSQFTGYFKTFCEAHCPVQNIPQHILQEAKRIDPTCCICYEKLNVRKKRDILWAECCSKTFYHKKCVQKLASSAGYFFRCPTCNDVQKFSRCVQKFGIFIPQQDASWELVPNAYEELLYRYNKCDAKICLCPHGRQREGENPMWEIILCESCGSQGIHVACGGLKHSNSAWECSDCQKVTKSMKFVISEHKGDEGSSGMLKLTGICQKKRRRGSEDLENLVLDKRKKYRQDVQEEEIEIDVETVDGEIKDNKTKRATDEPKDACKSPKGETKEVKKPDPQDVLTSLKPGPLSYKLGLLRKTIKNWQAQGISKEEKRGAMGTNPANPVVIIDSDEEGETDDDVRIMGVKKQAPEKHPARISPNKTNIVTRNLNTNEKEKSYSMVLSSSDFTRPQELPFSLNDFDVLAVMTLHSSGTQKEDGELVSALNKFPIKAEGGQDCQKYLTNSENGKSIDQISFTPQATTRVSRGKLDTKLLTRIVVVHTDKSKKEGLVQIDDEVEILME